MRPRSRFAALLLAGVAATAGCAEMTPSVPAGGQPNAAQQPAGAAVSSGTPGAPGASGGVAPGGSAPAKPGAAGSTSQKPTAQVSPTAKAVPADLGIDVYWHTNGDPVAVNAAASRVLDYVVSLHANSVGLTFPIFTDGLKPSTVTTVKGITPAPSDLALVIAAAKARGLRVLLRPVIDEGNISPAGGWRGSIQPKDTANWFAGYRTVLAPYFALAESTHVEQFVVGVELNSLNGDTTQWQRVVSDATKAYHGEISYAANWDAWYIASAPTPIQLVGLDAYPPVQLSDSASVDDLTAAWTTWLRHRSDATLQKTVIQELGIPAEAGSYRHPNNWGGSGATVDPQIQTSWFTAACRSAHSLKMRGIYFWMVDSNADPAHAGGYPTGSFIGRGDAGIKACFTDIWSRS
jgi:hypothetical protein